MSQGMARLLPTFLATPRTACSWEHLFTGACAQVLKDVQTIIAEQLGKDIGEVGPDAKFVDLGADSLDTVEIMMALEEKFELQVGSLLQA